MKQGTLVFGLLTSACLVLGEAVAMPRANPDANPTAAAGAAPTSSHEVANPPLAVIKADKDTKAPASTNAADFPPYQGGGAYNTGPPSPYQTQGTVPSQGSGQGSNAYQPAPPGQPQPLPFQPTASTYSCFNGGCQSIYYGVNTAYTIPDGGQGLNGNAYPLTPYNPNSFNGLCATMYNNGFSTISCQPAQPFGQGNCNTFQNQNGIATTNCNGFYANPCFTFYNNGQQSVTCTPTTTAQIFFTTSTQSFCNTFINGGATTTSCTTNYFTSATRTSISIVNAAKRTGVPRALMGQAVAGIMALGAAAVL